jgi:uncharacterized protein YwgA
MGKGIALGFKQRFPEMFADYARRCALNEVQLGRPYIFKRAVPPWIVNFPTKEHWRSGARLDAIVEGLQYLRSHYVEWGITSLAVPPLGCGEGGLDWKIVGPTLYRHLSTVSIPVELYAPWHTPEHQLTDEFLSDPARAVAAGRDSRNALPVSWVALAEILRRIAKEPYHYPIGRITFQKLAYFATVAGIPTELRFERSSYGPFSKASKTLIAQLVNNGLVHETPLGQMIRIDPGRTIEDATQRFKIEFERWKEPIDRVVDLLVRMNGRQAELAATVHFAAAELTATGRRPSETDVLRSVLAWKQRRRPGFSLDDIAVMVRRLNLARWISATYSEDLPVPSDLAA